MAKDEQGKAMLTHHQVWAAIEALARRHGMTASGLARRSGLDPTTFNRSKRIGNDGRQRWPSTESVAKILEATNVSLDEFLMLLRQHQEEEPGKGGLEEGRQTPYGPEAVRQVDVDWNAIDFPDNLRASSILLEVEGETMLPVYKPGTRIIARKGKIAAGDRVVVATRDTAVMIRDVVRKTRGRLFLQGWNPAQPDRVLEDGKIDWVAKVLWASQ